MKITVLGAVQVVESGRPYLPSAPKERQLMALLLLEAGRVVPISTCLAELWPEHAPRTARTTLQTYVMHLRNALASVPSVGSGGRAHAMLRTREPGYLLRVEPGQLDAEVFRSHVELGRTALAEGDDRTASWHLRAGLDLWHGAALGDVPAGPVLSAAVTRLDAARMAALELYVDAELRLGRHQGLLSELTALVRRYPANETLHGQYMLALYRSGRQVEALDVYQALVRRLRADHGVSPADRIRDLHRGILCAHPALDVPCAELSPT